MKKINKAMKRCLPFILLLTSCDVLVKVNTSEPDSKIYINGNYLADGNAKFKVTSMNCQTIKVEKLGYLTEEKKYCFHVEGYPKTPTSDYITLKKDESWDASVKTDRANIDFAIEVNSKYGEDQAWKIISQVITNYYDDIVTSSKETGYLVTAWKVQVFPKRTVRTRVIVKNSNSAPLTYKIKVCSEIATDENISVKSDEQFKEWDRVLKKYEGIISELQTRLGVK